MSSPPPNVGQRRRWNHPDWVQTWLAREAVPAATNQTLLGHLALAPGERVVDVGCGSGGLSLAAAAAIGPAGRVVGLDVSAPLVAVARSRLSETPRPQVAWWWATPRSTGLPAGRSTWSRARSGWCSSTTALANLADQAVTGGRLAFSCWQRAEDNPWWVGEVLARYRTEGPPASTATAQFSLADRVRSVPGDAGWAMVGHHPERRWAASRPPRWFPGTTTAWCPAGNVSGARRDGRPPRALRLRRTLRGAPRLPGVHRPAARNRRLGRRRSPARPRAAG